jgi:hypothetical protein
MKKIFTTVIMACVLAVSVMAVTVDDASGVYQGNLNIGGTPYPNKEIYILPGVTANTITFVLPNFKFGAASLGDIVLVNIPMNGNGQLTLDNRPLYIKAINERAEVSMLNGFVDGPTTYNSVVDENSAQVLLSIAAPSLPEPIFVLFDGSKVKDKNYAVNNGGFEGSWSGNEVDGWHSFPSATGDFAYFVTGNTDQFQSSTEKRPGSTGSQSARLQSNLVAGEKANGNCTNGQINAGSTKADAPADNYNFSDPANDGFNTPFQGRPDSVVFWAKYMPADRDAANEVNKARLSVALTTNARYQDPETGDFASAKIASAAINYAATPDFGWQRISVPFEYHSDVTPSYILTTFTSNQTPGGGSSYTTGSSFNKVNVLDTVYLDDVELIYNRQLKAFAKGSETLDFVNNTATVSDNYCDDCAKYAAQSDGVSSQTFIAFDATHKCIHIYVVADDYAQSGAYSLYRVVFADSETADLNPIAPTEGVDNISAKGKHFEKVLLNGQLVIRCGNEWYNISGTRIK